MTDYDAVVVGGGIVGASAAYHLARAGESTLLIDREDEGRATDAGAGIVSPATSSRSGSDAWYEFAVDAADYYPELAARLEREQDGEHGYAPRDLLSVAVEAGEVEPFEANLARIEERGRRLGRPDPDAVRELSPGAARERFPPLARPERALEYGAAARVDGRAFTAALLCAARGHGLAERAADVGSLRVAGGAVEGVVAGGEEYDAGAVVVAGGAWSPAFGDDLGIDVPVEPHRGQIAHLDVDADTSAWPIVKAFRGHYVVPWDDGRVAVGATREPDSGYAARATAGGVREVLDEALRVAPGLADAELREIRVGLRPVSADRLPVLGGVPGVEGAYLATGHGATGLQLGPYSGKLVAERVRESADDGAPIEGFGVSRFDRAAGRGFQ